MDGIVFTKDTTNLLTDWINDAIKSKVPFFFRGLVKPGIKLVLGLVSKYGDKVIPDAVDIYINEAITQIKQGNFDEAGKSIGVGMEILVGNKLKAGTAKQKFFINIGETLMSGIEYAIELKS